VHIGKLTAEIGVSN